MCDFLNPPPHLELHGQHSHMSMNPGLTTKREKHYLQALGRSEFQNPICWNWVCFRRGQDHE